MSKDLKVALHLLADPTGLDNGLRRGESMVKKFTGGVQHEFRAMSSALNSFGGKLAQLGVGIGAGTIFANQTRTFIEAEHHLREIGNAGNISKNELRGMQNELLETAIKTNQFRESLTGGIDVMVSSGMELRQAKSLIADIGNAATGTGASIEDLSKTAFSLSQNLKIKPDEMRKTLGILTSEGYGGAFELKDMARYFPIITASMQKLKFEGPNAAASIGAALQVSRQDAGTSEEAATNLKDWMSKVTSENLVRNFDKNFNINWEDVFKREILTAKDPLLATTNYINKIIGDNPFNLNKLFGNQEAMSFQMAMNHHMDVYKNIRKNGFMESDTVIDRSKNSMMDTMSNQWDRTKILIEATAQESKLLNSIWEKGGNLLKEANDHFEKSRPSMESLATGGLATVVGGYALSRLGGGIAKSIFGNLGSTAIGVMEGKALEKEIGLTPVFVTNWPTGGLGGNTGTKGGLLGDAVPPLPLAVRGAAMGGLGFMGSSFAVGAAGMGGLEMGKLLYENVISDYAADRIGSAIAEIFSPFFEEDRKNRRNEDEGKRPLGATMPNQNLLTDKANASIDKLWNASDRFLADNVGAWTAHFWSQFSQEAKEARAINENPYLQTKLDTPDKPIYRKSDMGPFRPGDEGGNRQIEAINTSGRNIEQKLQQFKPDMESAINSSVLADRIGRVETAVNRIADKKAALTIKIDGPGRVVNTSSTGFNISVDSGILPMGQQ